MLEKQSKWQRFLQIVSKLEIITALFSWIFNFLSRIAEPLMTLAVIYTIIVAGLPQAMVPALYTVALAVMIGAPEVILPGAFIMAGQQQQGGNKRAWMLFGVCLLFVLLTSLTLADLFVFHFNEIGTSILMCARCVTGVSYSILVRVVTHEQRSHHLGSSQTFDPQAFMNQILNRVSQMNLQLVQDIQHSQEQFMNQIAEGSQVSVNPALVQMEPTGTLALEAIARQQGTKQAASNKDRMHLLAPDRDIDAYVLQEVQSFADSGDFESEIDAVHEAPQIRRVAPAFTLREQAEFENDSVHESPEVQEKAGVHELHRLAKVEGGGKANRGQVCAFILDHWREHRAKPSIKFIRERTGCSQGLASACCKLVAREMNA